MRIETSWDSQKIARVALIIVAVCVGVWMLDRFLPALAWACVLAIATWPLRTNLTDRGVGRTTTAALLTLILAIVLVLPLIEIGFEAARDGGTFLAWVRDIRVNGLGTPDWVAHLPWIGEPITAWWDTNLASPEAARSMFGRAETSGIFALTRALGVQIAARLTILVFTLLTLFFLYRDGPGLADEAKAVAHRVFGPRGEHLGKNAIAAVRGTVNGLVLVGLVEGVLLGIAYVFAGLQHALLLGLVTGVLATVPFGAPVIYVLCAAALLVQSKTTAAIAIIVFGSLIVFVADHFVRPILIGNSTRLPFLWVLLGIFGGLETFGLIGIFLGPAVMSVLIAMWREGAEDDEAIESAVD